MQTQINDSKNIALQLHQVAMHPRKYRRQFRLQAYSKKKTFYFVLSKKKVAKLYFFNLLMTVKFAKFTSDLLAR